MHAPMRLLTAFLLTALAAFAVACGGDEETASSDTDVDTLLKETFSGSKKIESGKLDMSLRVDVKGAQGVNGPITVKLGGPFQSQGEKKLPKFKIDFAFEGAGQSIKAGLTSTGEKGFVSFQGSEYVVSDQVFKQFRTGYEQAQKQGTQQNQSLTSLGLDPRGWLTNAKNAGEADVGGDETIKITGGVDVNKLLDDVNKALKKTKDLGVQGTQELPAELTDAQRKQVTDAVKDPKVEIYTGKEDTILRRMVIDLGIVAPEGSGSSGGSADLKLDLAISGLNEDQEVSEPSNAKPFDQLLSQLGGLGLGNLGGASGSGSGSGSSGSGSGSGGNENLEKYSQCITDAGNDVDKARKCAELLTNP